MKTTSLHFVVRVYFLPKSDWSYICVRLSGGGYVRFLLSKVCLYLEFRRGTAKQMDFGDDDEE